MSVKKIIAFCSFFIFFTCNKENKSKIDATLMNMRLNEGYFDSELLLSNNSESDYALFFTPDFTFIPNSNSTILDSLSQLEARPFFQTIIYNDNDKLIPSIFGYDYKLDSLGHIKAYYNNSEYVIMNKLNQDSIWEKNYSKYIICPSKSKTKIYLNINYKESKLSLQNGAISGWYDSNFLKDKKIQVVFKQDSLNTKMNISNRILDSLSQNKIEIFNGIIISNKLPITIE